MSNSTISKRAWLAESLPRDVAQAIDKMMRGPDVQAVALMPDVHLAPQVCNGVVVATSDTLYPHAVGGDIGCGMAALAFDAQADALKEQTAAAKILSRLYRAVPSIKHSKKNAPVALPADIEHAPLSTDRLERIKRRDGRLQLGSLGRGNHFLEFQQAEEDQRLWLMLHSGSRGMGQAILTHHLQRCIDSDHLPRLAASSAEGQAYESDHRWALRYAELSRRAMAERTAELLEHHLGIRADWGTFFQCHHNYVQLEEHDGRKLWIHRKGALDAHQGQEGIIPGSMGTASYHVVGRGLASSLCSSSHGAGRRLSRSEARKTVSLRQLERQLDGVLFDRRYAERLRDEAPAAYKNIDAVMRAQRELTRIVRRLLPILSYKGV